MKKKKKKNPGKMYRESIKIGKMKNRKKGELLDN
jgi:hypothetical protein